MAKQVVEVVCEHLITTDYFHGVSRAKKILLQDVRFVNVQLIKLYREEQQRVTRPRGLNIGVQAALDEALDEVADDSFSYQVREVEKELYDKVRRAIDGGLGHLDPIKYQAKALNLGEYLSKHSASVAK